MGKISSSIVKHIATLANLPLTPDELTKYRSQLGEIVDYFEELQEVNTESIILSHTSRLENIYREDAVQAPRILSVNEAILNTDKIYNNYFVVPMLLINKDN